jgi:hypothetical protein
LSIINNTIVANRDKAFPNNHISRIRIRYIDDLFLKRSLVDKAEATLKHIEQYPREVLLIPANSKMAAMRYKPEQVEIQGALVGQMRSYTHKQ